MATRMPRFLVAGGLALGSGAALALCLPSIGQIVVQLIAFALDRTVGETWMPTSRRWFTDGILAGAAIAGTGLLLQRPERIAHLTATSRRRVSIAIAVTIAIQGLSIWFRRSAVVGGRRVWFLEDDPMISMRYGANLADGAGLVWNIGERVEGYTNFLWTCLMAAVHWVGFDRDSASAPILIVNLACSCALLIYVDRLLHSLGVRRSLAFVGLLLCAASRELLAWSISGFEVTALTLLFTVAVTAVTQAPAMIPKSAIFAVALVPLLRADGVVLSILVAVVALLIGQRRFGYVLAIAGLAPFALHLAFRLSYYGDWLPNTAHLKVTQWAGRLVHGASYDGAFVAAHFAATALAIVAVVRSNTPTIRALAAAVVLQFAYVWFIGGDAFAGGRFLAPILPVLFSLAVAGAAAMPADRKWSPLVAAVLVLLTPLLFSNRFSARLPSFVPSLTAIGSDRANLELADWLRGNTPRDAVVADYWAGAVFYFSERRGVDFLGKMDPVIARSAAVCDGGPPGHNKFDFSHSLGALKPHFVVAGFKLLGDGRMTGPSGEPIPSGDLSACRMFAALYEDGEFRAHYLPNVAGNTGWRTIYQRVE